jgi:hypothetical protein
VRTVAAVVFAAASCGTPTADTAPAATEPAPPSTIWSGAMNLPPALTADTTTTHALRGPAIQLTEPPVPTGIWGLPFAPSPLEGCDEMSYYRQQFGLPARFDAIGWRESNCRNEDGVHTACCHSYWQLWVTLHLRDHRLAEPYAACGVDAVDAINSDLPLDKQRATCAAAAVYAVVGYSAWSTS